MEPKLSKNVLWSYFAGQATPLQKQLIREWLRDDANREEFYRTLHEWEKVNPQFLPDAGVDYQQLLARVEQGNPVLAAPADEPLIIQRSAWLWLAAASVTLLLLAGWWQRETLFYKTYVTTYGQVRTIHLPDQSRVVLNANSTLKIPRFTFLQSNREVKLSGEAEFSVTHTSDHRRFLVHTPDHLEVEVLGTEFVVYSRRQGSKIVLNRGKVQIRSLKDTRQKPLTIRPGDVVTINSAGIFQRQTQQPVAEHVAWKEHRFVFNRTSLADIARKIQEQFGVTVLIPDSTLAAHQLSGNYPATNADELLRMMTRLLSLRLERQQNTVVLSPEN